MWSEMSSHANPVDNGLEGHLNITWTDICGKDL